MNTFAELFPYNDGLANYINTNHPDKYSVIFGSVSPDIIDGMTVTNYGDKVVISSLTPEYKATVLPYLIEPYIDDWVDAAQLLATKYNITTVTTTTQTSSNESNTTNNTGESVNGKKRFDDVNIVDDSKVSDTSRGDTSATSSSTTTQTVESDNARQKVLAAYYDKLDHLQHKIIKQFINITTLKLWT